MVCVRPPVRLVHGEGEDEEALAWLCGEVGWRGGGREGGVCWVLQSQAVGDDKVY